MEHEVAAPVDQVRDVHTDVEHRTERTDSMTQVRRLADGPLAVGSRGHVRQPRLRPTTWTVAELRSRQLR